VKTLWSQIPSLDWRRLTALQLLLNSKSQGRDDPEERSDDLDLFYSNQTPSSSDVRRLLQEKANVEEKLKLLERKISLDEQIKAVSSASKSEQSNHRSHSMQTLPSYQESPRRLYSNRHSSLMTMNGDLYEDDDAALLAGVRMSIESSRRDDEEDLSYYADNCLRESIEESDRDAGARYFDDASPEITSASVTNRSAPRSKSRKDDTTEQEEFLQSIQFVQANMQPRSFSSQDSDFHTHRFASSKPSSSSLREMSDLYEDS